MAMNCCGLSWPLINIAEINNSYNYPCLLHPLHIKGKALDKRHDRLCSQGKVVRDLEVDPAWTDSSTKFHKKKELLLSRKNAKPDVAKAVALSRRECRFSLFSYS
jgi:hypothetical protein